MHSSLRSMPWYIRIFVSGVTTTWACLISFPKLFNCIIRACHLIGNYTDLLPCYRKTYHGWDVILIRPQVLSHSVCLHAALAYSRRMRTNLRITFEFLTACQLQQNMRNGMEFDVDIQNTTKQLRSMVPDNQLRVPLIRLLTDAHATADRVFQPAHREPQQPPQFPRNTHTHTHTHTHEAHLTPAFRGKEMFSTVGTPRLKKTNA